MLTNSMLTKALILTLFLCLRCVCYCDFMDVVTHTALTNLQRQHRKSITFHVLYCHHQSLSATGSRKSTLYGRHVYTENCYKLTISIIHLKIMFSNTDIYFYFILTNFLSQMKSSHLEPQDCGHRINCNALQMFRFLNSVWFDSYDGYELSLVVLSSCSSNFVLQNVQL